MATRRGRKLWLKLAVLALSVGLTVLIIEVALGATGLAVRNNALFVPGKGGIYVPGAAYRHTREGFSKGRFNSHGFRDFERSLAKPQGTYRIAVFGDSFVEALQVDLEQSFSALLQHHFDAAHPTRNVEVLAFGHSGFGTSDELMSYRNYGAKFDPDLVVLAFLPWNDFRDNQRRLCPGDVRFFHQLGDDGELVLDTSRIDGYEAAQTLPKRTYQAVRRRSYLLSMLSEYLFLKRRTAQLRKFEASSEMSDPGTSTMNTSNTGREAIPANNALNIFLDQPAPVWDESFAITARVIEAFRDEVAKNGARFVVVSLSGSRQVHPERRAILESTYGPIFDFGRPDRFIASTTRELGIPFLNLYPALREHHLETGEYVFGFDGAIGGHWNEAGHRVAAKRLFTFLGPLVLE